MKHARNEQQDGSPFGCPSPIASAPAPFQEFAKFESAGGLLLLASAVAAMIAANSPISDSYFNFWNSTKFSVAFGEHGLSKPLILWVNDLLMAISTCSSVWRSSGSSSVVNLVA
jgi:hypothetical protein